MARLREIPETTFVAIDHIRRTALVEFDSLFTTGQPIWNRQNLREFHGLFVGRFETGKGRFLQKFKKQLDGANDQVVQLGAELLYVQQFFTSLIGGEKKIENVQTVLGWAGHPAEIPSWATEGVRKGLAKDQSFNQIGAWQSCSQCCRASFSRDIRRGSRGMIDTT